MSTLLADRGPQPSLTNYRPHHFADLVRCGADADGGYVLPRRLIDASTVLLSLGVGADWSFEEAVLRLKPAIRIICVDGTTSAEKIRAFVYRELWKAFIRLRAGKFIRVARLWSRPREFRQFFARHEFIAKLVLGQSRVDATTLGELLAGARSHSAAAHQVLLKIDIEGYEYEVLESALERLAEVSGMVIEFHGLERHWARFARLMQVLREQFYLAHIHGNNLDRYIPGTQIPRTLEITLLAKRLCPEAPPLSAASYPLPGLDHANLARRADLALRFD